VPLNRETVPREKIDDVRDRTNIVEIIKRYVELKRAGTGSWKGLCPFHSEKTPSFQVHELRQFFHCFGCGEKGDVITFLRKIEQRSFMEVLQDLAGTAGVELEARPLSPAERLARKEAESERDRMFRVMETAAAYFQEQLASPAGEAARAYVDKRGIGAAVAGRFRVGYAPARWDGLSSHLAGKKIPSSDLERLGLVGVNERGRYDFFRDRVMLPVIDRQKRVIGFGGRLLDPDAKDRKYVNSPDTPLFHKKEQLYGLHTALDAIRKSGTVIVVEGNFDVLTLHEAGIEEAVAPMGTALTSEQLKVLDALAKRIVIVFDGDGAGMRAAKKSIAELVAVSNADVITGVRIARLERGLDPDDFVRTRGAEAFRQLVDTARPFLDHMIHEAAQDPTIPGRLASLAEIADVLVKVQNPTARELYTTQAAGVLGLTALQVRRAILEAASKRTRPPAAAPVEGNAGDAGRAGSAPVAPQAPAPAPRKLPAEELHVLVVMASYPDLVRTPEAIRAGELLIDPGLRQLHRAAVEQVGATGRIDIPAWLDAAAEDVRPTVAAALMDGSIASVPNAQGHLRKLVARLEILRVDAEMSMNKRLLTDARARGDEATARAILSRGIALQQTIEGLQATLKRP
jgi:DNA primase